MGLISNYFGEKKYLNLADLKQEEENKKKASRPKSTDDTSTSRINTNRTISELVENDWFTFATINAVTALFAKPKVKLETENEEQWNTFFENMRLYGENTSVHRLRSELKRDMCAYGAGYLEFIPAENSTEIVDLKKIDASKIEHAKDNKGYLILNEKGESIGYVLHLGPNVDTRGRGDTIPHPYEHLVSMNTGDVFLLPSRVAELPLYKRGNGIEPMGLIEPAITQTNRRKSLETAQVNAIWIRGTAPLYSLVGDEKHEPNPQMLDDALDSLEEMKHSKVSAFPYYSEPKALDVNIDDSSSKIMENLMYASSGASGAPLPFITGAGEATNRSTLKTQRELFESNIQQKVENFDEDWNMLVMKKISAINGFADAKMISGEVRLESKDEFAKRLNIYYEMRGLSPREIRKNIVKHEDLELDEDDYNEYLNNLEPQSVSQSFNAKGAPKRNNEEEDEDEDINEEEEDTTQK
ncbi:MAG: hypothetical protein ACOC1X_00085 [Promethearchaeota archaeon]